MINYHLVKQQVKLTSQKISAASGIEFFNNHFYVVGDNSPNLFKLNNQLEIVDTFKLINSDREDVIPKKVKPDFEATTIVSINNKNHLLIFGSGSKTNYRNLLIVFDLDSHRIDYTFSLLSFYNYIQQKTGAEINIEGAIAVQEKLLLFNRATNQVYVIDFADLIQEKYLVNEKCCHVCDLKIPNQLADAEVTTSNYIGISGATYLEKNKIICYTASVEQTTNWIDDGKILGSYFGIISLNQIVLNQKVELNSPLKISDELKIESLCLNGFNDDIYQFIMVADPDDNSSIFTELIVSITTD